MFAIRSCEECHYEAVARIHNAIRPEPTTGDSMLRSDRLTRSLEGAALLRVVGEDAAGQVIGYAFAERALWMPDGMWCVKVMVDPAARGKGLGRALYAHVKQAAVEGGATFLESWVDGGDDESFAWSQRRDFYLDRERTESVLDLTRFDMTRFAGVRERVEQGGLRLAATTETDDDLLHQIWDLDCITSPDVPIWDPDEKMPSFAEYRAYWHDDLAVRVVAGCFDGDRLVGVSFLSLPTVDGGGAYTGFTGVYREYRGRSIALALKLLTIDEAIRRGSRHMRTNNDPDNPPMLAVNARLGYQLVPGPRRIRMPL